MASSADTPGKRVDGNIEFSGGMDASRSPSMLDRNMVAAAVNSTFRGGKWTHRPGFVKRTLNFGGDATLESRFKTGMFQHLSFYNGNDIPSLISVHGGRVFKQDLLTLVVSEITPPEGINSPSLRQGWSLQAENYWIYQDNQSFAVIYDGAGSRRANPDKKEIPVGNVMAYTNGRIIVGLKDRYSFRAGDLLYGPSGSSALGYKDAILKFTENDYLNEGGDLTARVFGAPSNYGPIKSMRALSQTNTQLGQGSLLVGTPFVIFSINLPFDRTTWKNLSSPLQTVIPVVGPLGQNSTLSINTDMWYRGVDGFRSYIMALRDTNTWSQTPMSSELGDLLAHDDQSLLEYGSGVLYDNRMLQTVSPVQTVMGTWHRGLAALDFNLVSTMNIRKSPAWEGVWTGLRILQIVSGLVAGKERCFLYALNDADEIESWELDKSQYFDNGDTRIEWSGDLPSYNCGDGFGFKRLDTGELFIDSVRGQVNGSIIYRSDQNACWQGWSSFEVCAKYKDCGPFDCAGPKTFQQQFRSKIRLPQPADDFDEINGRRYRTGYEFQPRLEMKGSCEVKQLRLIASDEPETSFSERSLK